jgi:acetyltransferase-like isoleucine patch superfamily enzyme
MVEIGDNCVFDSMPGARREHVTLFTNSPDAVIRIGNRTQLFGTRMSCKYSISVLDDAVVEDAAIADTDFHAITADRADAVENPAECRVVIGERASIGSWSVIGKGVIIGRDAKVIAGSIVRKSVPDAATVSGNPARPVSV